MNSKLKALLVGAGALLLSVPVVRAQGHGFGGGARGASFAARPALASRPLANNARSFRGGGYGRGSYYRGGYGHGYGYGRYYYLGGVPYFYPFGFGYGGFYGDGFYGGYGDGFYGGYAGGGYGEPGYDNEAGYGNGAYEGRIYNNRNGQNEEQGGGTGPSLPSAVQRQLSKRGYYKGAVDGQFGPASRDALKRFQKSQGLKATGNIDEDSLDALGFTDKRQ